MRDEEQGGHRWERVRGKHSRRCAPATGGVPMPKMRCIDRKVRAESRSSEQTNLGSSTCHGLPCGFAVITNRNPHSRRTGGISDRFITYATVNGFLIFFFFFFFLLSFFERESVQSVLH